MFQPFCVCWICKWCLLGCREDRQPNLTAVRDIVTTFTLLSLTQWHKIDFFLLLQHDHQNNALKVVTMSHTAVRLCWDRAETKRQEKRVSPVCCQPVLCLLPYISTVLTHLKWTPSDKFGLAWPLHHPGLFNNWILQYLLSPFSCTTVSRYILLHLYFLHLLLFLFYVHLLNLSSILSLTSHLHLFYSLPFSIFKHFFWQSDLMLQGKSMMRVQCGSTGQWWQLEWEWIR